MLILKGEFMNIDSNENQKTQKTSLYVKVLDMENSEVVSVKVPSFDAYKGMKRGDLIEIPLKVSAYNGKVYYQENR